ncbi:hypothetical protein [Aeromicrobium sp. A1-2]|nr:hypothetical protein [Aeromicrobium sp. A1-2]
MTYLHRRSTCPAQGGVEVLDLPVRHPLHFDVQKVVVPLQDAVSLL